MWKLEKEHLVTRGASITLEKIHIVKWWEEMDGWLETKQLSIDTGVGKCCSRIECPILFHRIGRRNCWYWQNLLLSVHCSFCLNKSTRILPFHAKPLVCLQLKVQAYTWRSKGAWKFQCPDFKYSKVFMNFPL